MIVPATTAAPANPSGVPPRIGSAAWWVASAWWVAAAATTFLGVYGASLSRAVPDDSRAVAVAFASLVGVALVLSRRAPAPALVLVFCATLGAVLIAPNDPALSLSLGTPLVAYAVGRRSAPRAVRLSVGLSLALWLVIRTVSNNDDSSIGSVVSVAAFFIVAPVAVGRGVRDRARLRAVLRQRAQQEEADLTAGAERARLDERTEIAGELHDVVAHALSAMVVQASGARLLAEREPAAAGAAFTAVERTGRDALFEIRSLLGILREAGADDELLEPQPSLEHVEALVGRAQRAGLPSTLRVSGAERALAPGLSLTAYRAIQDALRSARDEGGAGSARVHVSYASTSVEITVLDDGPGSRPPLATATRIALYGGEVTLDRTDDGDHRVAVLLHTSGRP